MVAVALLALLALVTLAASGGNPFDDESARSGSSRAASDYLVTFALSLAAVAVALTLYLIRPSGRFRHDRAAGHGLGWSLVALALAVGFGIAILVAARGNDSARSPERVRAQPPRASAGTARREEPVPAREVDFQWPVVLALGGAAVVAAAAATIVTRRSRRRGGKLGGVAELTEELGALLDATLDDLRAEPDARRAVVAAYARMERVFAAHGVARRPFEAPHEYLHRLARALADAAPAAERLAVELTRLYERAKFSAQEIDSAMKADAIAALEALREELRDSREEAAA